MGILKNGLAVLALVAMAGTASATSVTLSAQNSSDIFDGGGKANIRYSNSGDTGSASAGGLRVTDGVSNFVAWCLDIANRLSIPSAYTITDTPFSATTGTFTATVQNSLVTLFNTAYSAVDLSSNAQSAGFQLALWEIVNEGKPSLDVTSGDFRWTGGSTGARDFAKNYLAMMSGPQTMQFELTFFEAAVDANGKQLSQNLVSVAPIPLPAGVWLLGAGLLGLAALGRRRRTDTA